MSELLVLWLLFTVIPFFSVIGEVMILLTFLGVVSSPLFMLMNDSDPKEWFKHIGRFVSKKIVWIPYFVILTISFFTPNTEQMKYIIGGYFAYNSAEYISDVKGADKLPENIVNAVNSYLKKVSKDDGNN